jgi:hypothetical protein
MHWYFRDISDDPSEKELTQQDQFNNDEVALAEAIVRETIQNSTDAQATSSAPVRVRFAIHAFEGVEHRAFFTDVFAGLASHWRACQMQVPSTASPIRTLVIEDFGTTGLTGSVEIKDSGQFSGFWRRFGRSNKQGSKGGRWGLGKLVFPSASAVRTVIGLTRRAGDASNWVMGQAVLRNHAIDNLEKDSVGFWCVERAGRPGLPTNDASLAEKLSRAAALRRTSENGLSLVVPALLPDITSDHLIAAAVRNYYFPILTGRLVVEIDDIEVSEVTFERIAQSLPSELVPRSLLAFVRQLQEARLSEPTLTLPPTWQRQGISADTLGPDNSEKLRELYKTGKLLAVRAPLQITSKGDGARPTHVDLFLKAITPGERAQTLVVRGSITVPSEGKKINLPDSHAALVATDEAISKLLGDAENPAHTQWNERAEKLRLGWEGGASALRRVRAALPELYGLVAERIERDDPLALLEFFSIPRSDRAGETRPVAGRPDNLPAPTPKPFRIEKRVGGFAILPNGGILADQFPMKLRVRCAYDILSGNPYKRYSEYDFSFYSSALEIAKENADYWAVQGNELEVVARGPEFKVEVSGFDQNRDLIIEAQM